ncbi:MAG: MFS transporter [Chloroflexi bacterium]|nr:MFS transporter [Chloroflexota bacterium]
MPAQSAQSSAAAAGTAHPNQRTGLGRPSDIFIALRNAQYRRYMGSFVFASFGFQAQDALNGWLAYTLTGKAFSLGSVLFVSGAAQAGGALIGGVMADRFNRQRLIILSQGLIGLAALATAVLVLSHHIQIWHLYLSSLLAGLGTSMHMPARQAFVHDIVGSEEISNAVAVNAAANNTMRLVAPAVAGGLIASIGIGSAYIAVVIAYVLSMAGMMFVGSKQRVSASRRVAPLREFNEGVRELWTHRNLFWLLMLGLVSSMLGLQYRYMMPAFTARLGHGAGGWGLLLSMAGAGAMLASIGIAAAANSSLKGRIAMTTCVLWGGLMAVMAVMPNMPSAIPVLLVLGGVSTATNTLINILIQTNVDDEHRGRLLSFWMLSFSLSPIFSPAVGKLVDIYGVREVLLGTGAVLFVIALVLTICRRDLREMA